MPPARLPMCLRTHPARASRCTLGSRLIIRPAENRGEHNVDTQKQDWRRLGGLGSDQRRAGDSRSGHGRGGPSWRRLGPWSWLGSRPSLGSPVGAMATAAIMAAVTSRSSSPTMVISCSRRSATEAPYRKRMMRAALRQHAFSLAVPFCDGSVIGDYEKAAIMAQRRCVPWNSQAMTLTL